MAKPKNARDVLVTELKEIYSAERQLVRASPKMLRAVETQVLKEGMTGRRERAERIIETLDDIFEQMDVTKSRPKNIAAEGLITDAQEHLEELSENKILLEPVLLATLQKLEHYCIASWGTARSLGRLLDEKPVAELMENLLKDGRDYDEYLTGVAEKELNPRMRKHDAG